MDTSKERKSMIAYESYLQTTVANIQEVGMNIHRKRTRAKENLTRVLRR